MLVCNYDFTLATSLYFLDVIGFSIGIAFYVAGIITNDAFPTFYSLFLKFSWIVMWILRIYFNILIDDTECPGYQYYAFPNAPTYYVTSFATLIVMYNIQYKTTHKIGWINGSMLFSLVLIPPFILVWFQRIAIHLLLITFIMSVLLTTAFMLVIYHYVRPVIPILIRQNPLKMMGFTQNYYLKKK